ncbi:MAG: DinB family protein [Chryseolinea sp.]
MTELERTSNQLREIVSGYYDKMKMIADTNFSTKPSSRKWSKKEVVGHLVDSAQNNLRRFITGQYEKNPPHIVYAQEFWVDVNHYNQADKDDVLLLWKLINERICVVIENMPESNYQKACNTGKDQPDLHALDWLARDYVEHLKHHLNQIIPHSFPGHIYPK